MIAVITGTLPETCVIFGCFGASALVWLVSILSGRTSIPIGVLVFGMVASILICWKYAPVDTQNNPIVDPDYRKRRKIIATALTGIALIIVLVMKDDGYRNYVALPVMIEAFTLLQCKNVKVDTTENCHYHL